MSMILTGMVLTIREDGTIKLPSSTMERKHLKSGDGLWLYEGDSDEDWVISFQRDYNEPQQRK